MRIATWNINGLRARFDFLLHWLRTRQPAIMADAAHAVLTRPSRECSGRFFIDDDVLAEAGVTDLSRYRPEGALEAELMPDFFLD